MEFHRLSEPLATKQDVLAVKQDVLAVKEDVLTLRHEFKELRSEFNELRSELKHDLAEVCWDSDSKMAKLREELKVALRDSKVEVVRSLFLAIMGQTAIWAGLMYFFLQFMRT